MLAQFVIEGMTCEGCVRAVGQALSRAGVTVESVEVGRARIRTTEADDDATTLSRAKAAIENAGFQVAGVDHRR